MHSTSDNHRERWGYSFEWTDKHLPAEEIAALRSHVDELGSAAFEKLQALTGGGDKKCPIRPELYTILRDHHQEDPTLESFWQELHSVPDWVDWTQIERAQRFFARYALANSTAFALQGFIRENSVRSTLICNHQLTFDRHLQVLLKSSPGQVVSQSRISCLESSRLSRGSSM